MIKPFALEELERLIDPDMAEEYNQWLDKWLHIMSAENFVTKEEAMTSIGETTLLRQKMIAGAKHKIATVLHKQDGIFTVNDDFPKMEVTMICLRSAPNEY